MPLTETLDRLFIPYERNVPLKNHTTFRIGGPADLFITPRSVEELGAALMLCRAAGEEPFLLGNGSNLLVSDAGLRRPVILLGEAMSRIRREGNRLYAEAGALLIKVCREALSAGLSGMEWAYGIPGSLGGGVYMNAGAYGGELKDVVAAVTYYDEKGELRTACGEELAFGYRKSLFEEKNYCIVAAELALTPGDPEEIRAQMEDFMGRRREKQPLDLPSAGSTFKRPLGNYASALIDQCGLKGLRVGDAAVSEKHAGFVVNLGSATAEDVKTLIEEVRQTVVGETGYLLECEIKMIE